MSELPGFDVRTAADHLADAERFERWAMRTEGNPRLSDSFRRLAAESRARARLLERR